VSFAGHRAALAALLLLAATLDSPAEADEPLSTATSEPAVAASPAPLAPEQLAPVTVTANKRPETLEKVSASVSVVDGDFLRQRATGTFLEVVDYTPNVDVTLSGSAGQFIIRGLGTPDTNLGFDPSVGLVVDGVYYGRSNFLSAFFNDIDRFEVLRGPQGTLFGKNSTSGVFNLVSQRPGTDWQAQGELLARGYGDLSVRPALTIPVSADLSLRLSGNFQHGSRGKLYNTYLDRPENNNQQDTVRLRGRWNAPWDITVDFGAFHSHQYLNNSNFLLTTLLPGMEQAIRHYDPNFDANPLDRKNSTDFPSAENAMLDGVSSTVEVPLPDWGGIHNFRLTSISAWARSKAKDRNIDADFTPIPFISDKLGAPSIYQQLSQEFRFSGSGRDLFGYGHGINFIAGVYLLRSTYSASDIFSLESLSGAAAYCTAGETGTSNCNGLVPGGGGDVGLLLAGPLSRLLPYLGSDINNQTVHTGLAQHEDSLAGFGQFEYSLLENWALIGGLRYGIERKQGLLSAEASSPVVMAIADSENHTTALDRSERDYSPKLGLRYTFDKNASTYFTWARGYKSGGYNGLPLRSTQNEYGPERASSFEAGAKARLLDGRLRGSLSLFSTDFNDLQVSTFQNNRFIVLNAAQARSRGLEGDMQWLPEFLPFMLLRASAGLSNARYLSYPNAPCYADAQNHTDYSTVPPTQVTCTQDLSGQRLPFGSRVTSTLGPDVFFPLGNGLRGTLGGDVVYRGSRFLDVDDDPRKLQTPTTVVNLHFTLNDSSRQWALTLAVRNLTNIQYYAQRLGQPLAPGNFASSGTNEPRMFLQSISYNF
jgi:iron complex outermembrane recepter protein